MELQILREGREREGGKEERERERGIRDGLSIYEYDCQEWWTNVDSVYVIAFSDDFYAQNEIQKQIA